MTALDTDHLELELEDAPFAVNSWTKVTLEAVAALDAQEYDSTIFGSLQVSVFWSNVFVIVQSGYHLLLMCCCFFFCTAQG